jgi:uncharacterized FlaG/YvyC family protein
MEKLNSSTINTGTISNLYNEQTLKPVHTHKTAALSKDQTIKSPEISFSVEKDLHVIVTTVKDPNTKKMIQQIPSEDAIRRMRFIKTYLASQTDEGRN